MAARTPLHTMVADEAKKRGFKRCGTGWVFDYGDLVAEIKLESARGWYNCTKAIFVKLDHVPVEYLECLEWTTPNMIHIYIPPVKSPDRKSHLIKVVNHTSLGPYCDDDEWELSGAEHELLLKIRMRSGSKKAEQLVGSNWKRHANF